MIQHECIHLGDFEDILMLKLFYFHLSKMIVFLYLCNKTELLFLSLCKSQQTTEALLQSHFSCNEV